MIVKYITVFSLILSPVWILVNILSLFLYNIIVFVLTYCAITQAEVTMLNFSLIFKYLCYNKGRI